jgi:hypothetical protein
VTSNRGRALLLLSPLLSPVVEVAARVRKVR